MRTKTLLLTAAAIAASLGTSMAQSNVYSVNIVGYVNTVTVDTAIAGQGKYTLLSNPLDDGNGNQLTNLMAILPNKSQVLVWNGSGYSGSTKGSGGWGTNFQIPPGTGFFVKNGISTSPALTNTFVGNVLNSTFGFGMSNTVAVAAGYTLAGSPLPYGGDLTTDTNINLGASLPNKSQLLIWDVPSQTYQGSTKGASGWSAPLNADVSQGFFINAKSATNWVQTLH